MTILDIMPKISPEKIVRMADSYQSFQVMFTAVKHDIFTVLSEEPKTAEQIAQEIKKDSYIIEKLLNALVSIGLLVKGSRKYSNTALAETFLVKEKPFYQGNYINAAKTISFGTSPYDDWAKIDQALEQGYVQPDNGDMPGWRLYDESFSLTMKEAAVRGEVQATAEVISNCAWFKNAKKLIDLGGTHGLYAIAFADKNPELEATLFDFPGVPELGNAKKYIDQYDMNGRVKIQEGNFMEGNIGNGYDIVLMSHVYLQGAKLDAVLSKIYGALNENGMFILKNCVIPRNREGSLASVLGDLDMCFWSDEQQMYSIEEYVDLIEAHGLKMETIAKIEECAYGPSAILVFKKEGK
jgi:predicted O-methyltransferase YrrM